MYIKNAVGHLDQTLIRCIAVMLMVAMIIPVELASFIDLSTDDSTNRSYGAETVVLGDAGGHVDNLDTQNKGLDTNKIHFCIALVDGTPNGQFYITDTKEPSVKSTFILDSTDLKDEHRVILFNSTNIQSSTSAGVKLNLSSSPSRPALQYYTQIYNALKSDKDAFESSGWEAILNQSKNVDNVWKYVLGTYGGVKQVDEHIAALWNPEGLNYANLGDDEETSLKAKAYFLDMLYSLYWISPGPETGSTVRPYIKERIKRVVDGSFSDKPFTLEIYPL